MLDRLARISRGSTEGGSCRDTGAHGRRAWVWGGDQRASVGRRLLQRVFRISARCCLGRAAISRRQTEPGGLPPLPAVSHVDTVDAVAAGQALTQQLVATPGITTVSSYWGPGKSELLRSHDGTKALILAHVEGNERDFPAAARRLIAAYRDTERGPLQLQLGGEVISYVDVTDQLNHDLKISDAVAMPVILVLMTLVFGSLVAAGLPLVIGVLSIMGSLGLLALLSDVTPVSNYALNVTTVLGLALAIDYSLLVLTRFRRGEEADSDPR